MKFQQRAQKNSVSFHFYFWKRVLFPVKAGFSEARGTHGLPIPRDKRHTQEGAVPTPGAEPARSAARFCLGPAKTRLRAQGGAALPGRHLRHRWPPRVTAAAQGPPALHVSAKKRFLISPPDPPNTTPHAEAPRLGCDAGQSRKPAWFPTRDRETDGPSTRPGGLGGAPTLKEMRAA